MNVVIYDDLQVSFVVWQLMIIDQNFVLNTISL
jgi:hypothetical protein